MTKKSESMIDFKELSAANQEVHIIVHNFPDPDCIASALGMIQVLKMSGQKPGNIYYTGEISHPQNRALLTIMNADLVNYESKPFEKGSSAIVVDCGGVGKDTNQTGIRSEDVSVLAVVDHHKTKHPKGAKVDSRYVGACASIVWDYLRSLKYDFDSDDGKQLATALAVGIFTDTTSLTSDNMQALDFEAYQSLIKAANKQQLANIMEYPLPPYLFDLRQKAFLEENKRIEESTIVSGIGIISQSKRDAIPIIADEFLRMTGITTSIVFAIIDDYVDVSVRSKNITMDVSSFVQKVFGNGGGKQGAGRAQIPLGFFCINGDETLNQEIWEVCKKILMHKVFANVKGE